MSEISYEALRKIQLQERNFGALSNLEEDFYEKYNLWISEQKRLLQREFSIEALKAYENSKKIIEEIAAKREQKITLKALKDLRSSTVDSAGLSKEEKGFYLKLLSAAKEFENTVVQFSEKKEELRKEAEQMQKRLQTIKLLVGMSKFVAPDGSTYGPYEIGQIVSIGDEIAEILLKKGAAEKTDVMEGIESIEAGTNQNSEKKGGLPDTVIIN